MLDVKDDDDLSEGYGVTAHIRQELNSPAMRLLAQYGSGESGTAEASGENAEDIEKTGTEKASKKDDAGIGEGRWSKKVFVKRESAAGLTPKEIEFSGIVKDSEIDLPSSFFGGLTGPLKIGLAHGAKFAPTLIRSLGGGIFGGLSEIPTGMMTEKVEEKYPKLALPFSVLTGMGFGMTLERAGEKGLDALIKKGVRSSLAKQGIKQTDEVVAKEATKVRANLEAGKVEDETTAGVVKNINETLKTSQGVFFKPSSPQFIEARNQSPKIEFLPQYDEKQLSSFDKYLSPNAKVGYAVTPEKNLVNVFNNSGHKGAGTFAVADAIEKGALTLDCFGEGLKNYYEKFGFRVYKMEPWDPKKAPKNWDLTKHGTFNTYYMRFEGGSRNAQEIIRQLPEDVRGRIESLGRLDPGIEEFRRSGQSLSPEIDAGDIRGKGSGMVQGQSDLIDVSGGLRNQSSDVTLRHLTGDPNKPLVEVSQEKVDTLLQKAGTFLQQDVTDLPEKAININFGRIESEDDIKSVIARTAEVFKDEIQETRRHVQTNEQTSKLAALIGLSPEQLLARRRGQAFNAEEALAARRILVSSGERLSTLARIVSGRVPAAGTEFADATLPELQAAFQKQLLIHAGIQEQVSGMTAEAGRALQSFRIMAKSTEGKLKQVDELMANLGKAKISTEALAARIAGIDSGEGLNTTVRQVRKATSWDMVMEAWINGLLSGPVTHAANTLSNGLVALLQVPERVIAAGISKLTGDEQIKLAEAGYQAYGLVEGFKDGLKAFGKTVRTGEGSEQFTKVDLPMRRAISARNFGIEEPGIAARAIDLLGEGVRIPGRLLTAEDEFFKTIGYRMELRAMAFRQASAEGLQGPAATKRIQEILADPPDDIHAAAIDAARYQTFTRDLGETGAAGMRFLSKVPALRLIIPFVQTPANILKFAGERTPLAFASRRIREDIAAGGARRDLAFARISMGSMIMGTAAGATAAGLITGGGPTDPELRQAKMREGWQPYSIRLGDKYYAFNRLEPLGMLLGLAADATEIMGQASEADAQELAAAVVVAISKNVTSKTWLKGVADAVEALDDPERSAKKFLMNYARTFVPAGVAQIEKITDPTVREVYDQRGFFYEILNNIKARTPGWSGALPPKRNLWGEAITSEGAFGPDILSPVYMSTAKDSPIDAEMVRLKMGIGMPAKIQSFEGESIPLQAKEYDKFIKLMNTIPLPSTGATLKKSLDRLVTKDPEYRLSSDDRKELMIRRHILQAKEMARVKLIEEIPALRFLLDQVHQERSLIDSNQRRNQPGPRL